MFESLNPKTRERIERRLSELELNRDEFLSRFDLDGDGSLNDSEKHAALTELLNEFLKEESTSRHLNDSTLLPSKILKNRFQIVSEIGKGSQSIAYVARDLGAMGSSSMVVVKQLRLSHLDAWETYDAFRREAEILSRLCHPRLPKFIDAFQIEEEGRYSHFSVQSLLPGQNLAECLELGRLFSEEDIISIGTQCLDILSYLHGHRPAVLHRDIKPSNLLFDEDGQIYLIDFGAVQYASSVKTLSIGTTGYMASEQMMGSAIPASDLYSLGATLIRLATGRQPSDLELKRLKMIWRPFASLSDEVSDWIDALIAPEIESRFQSATSARTFLKKRNRVPKHTIQSQHSLDLVEIYKEKPSGSEVKLWESVDQFVCTFPKNTSVKRNAFGLVTGIMDSLLNTNNYRILATNGGGFSFDGLANCKIHSDGTELLHRKVFSILQERFEVGDAGLVAIYNSKKKRSARNVRVCLIVGLTEAELDWVSNRLATFLASHDLYLM